MEFTVSWPWKILAGLIVGKGVTNYLDGLAGANCSGADAYDDSIPFETRLVMAAIESSPVWQREMAQPGATIESVTIKLGLYNCSTEHFERVLGVKHPLF